MPTNPVRTNPVRTNPWDKFSKQITSIKDSSETSPRDKCIFYAAATSQHDDLEKLLRKELQLDELLEIANRYHVGTSSGEKKVSDTQLTQIAVENMIPDLLETWSQTNKRHNLPLHLEVLKVLATHHFHIIALFYEVFFPCFTAADLKIIFTHHETINIHNQGYTPLHFLVVSKDHFGWAGKLDFLLDKKVDPNSKDQNLRHHNTPLHMAVANEAFSSTEPYNKARILINKYCERSLYNWDIPDWEGKSVLILATKMRASSLVRLLLSKRKEHTLAMNLDLQDEDGYTALHYAAALGDMTSVKLLIEAGANTTICNKQGLSPLEYVKQDNKAKIIAILKSVSIDPERDEGALQNFVIDTHSNPVKPSRRPVVHAYQDQANMEIPLILQHIGTFPPEEEKVKIYDIGFFEIQRKYMTGKTLLHACMDGQIEVKKYLSETPQAQTSVCVSGETFFVAPQTPTATSLKAGDYCELAGLQSRPELNGCTGKLGEWHAEKERFEVEVDGQEKPVLVRPNNLRPASSVASVTIEPPIVYLDSVA